MRDLPLLLALTAGVLAAVNPCGFALLPAYLSLLVAGDGGRAGAIGRALSSAAAMTGGFVAVFGGFGLLVAPAASWLQQRLPWFTIGLGLLLAAAGGWLLAGRALPAPGARLIRAPVLTRSWASMALFGAAYALASLSCTVGPFLAIVGSSLRAGSTVAGLGLFLAYAAGMGLVTGAAALAVALVRTPVLHRVRRAAPALCRAGGALLLLTGGYVAYYGWYEVRLAADGPAALGDPVIGAGGRVQQWLARGLDSLGTGTLAAVFGVLLAAAVALATARRAGSGDSRPTAGGPPAPRSLSPLRRTPR